MVESAKKSRALTLIAILLFTSCNGVVKTDKVPIARVYDSYLYADEVEAFVPKGASRDDSLLMADSYTRDWVTHHLLLHKAEEYLNSEQKHSIEEQVKEYSMALLIHLYMQELINSRLEYSVTEEEIEAYYNENADNFILSTPVVRALFIIIPKENSRLEIQEIKNLFHSSEEDDFAQLQGLSLTIASKFDDFDGNWIEAKSLLNLIPGDVRELESAITYRKYIETDDEENYYLLRIDEIKLENTIAPYEYVKESIALILNNQKKVNFEHELEDEINEEGVRKNNVTIY